MWIRYLLLSKFLWRQGFVRWAKRLAEEKGVQIIAFGALKAPVKIPGVQTHWIERGRILEEAA